MAAICLMWAVNGAMIALLFASLIEPSLWWWWLASVGIWCVIASRVERNIRLRRFD